MSPLPESISGLSSLEEALKDPQLPDTPWRAAAASREYATALELVERELATNSDKSVTKLWWVRLQVEQKVLPVTALSAPLNELTEPLRGEIKLATLAASTYLQIALALLERKQPRLAIPILEHALYFSRQSSHIEETKKTALADFYLEELGRELEQAPLRKEPESYLETIAKRIEDEKQARAAYRAPTQVAPKPTTPSITHLSSKHILQQAEQEVAQSPTPHEIPEGRSRTASGSLLLLICLFLLLGTAGVGAATWYLVLPALSAKPAEAKLAMSMGQEQRTEALLPELLPRQNEEQRRAHINTTLDTVGSRLRELDVGTNDQSQEQGGTGNEQGENNNGISSSGQVDQSALDPSNAKSLPDDGELVSISTLPDGANDIPENSVPTSNPKDFSKNRVESVGNNPRGTAVSGRRDPRTQVRLDSNGRAIGNPQMQDPASPNRGNTALDGSALKSYEVEEFAPPKLFRTITSTEVLAAPSLLAKSLAHLEPQTPVHVTRKMGHWLELRSVKGKVGYIYAQDARAD